MQLSEEFAKECEEVYQKNKEEFEKQYLGKLVALYEGGIAAVGEDIDKVLESATSKYPDKIFYVRRVGKNPASAILF
ncbi:MAG: hypothetical protein H3Z51_09450 [archaeon]|nr:hypothetical protein [archaeon]